MSTLLRIWHAIARRRSHGAHHGALTPRQQWIEDYAVRNRPILRCAEYELAMLAELACRELEIPESKIPDPSQASVVHARVSTWVRDLRRRVRARSL